MSATLVDSNIILDILKKDDDWKLWSGRQVLSFGNAGALLINPIVYAEIAVAFETTQDLASMLEDLGIELAELPWEAAFFAGQTHAQYRRNGGARHRTLPDFMIGAHAKVKKLRLLTRDVQPYRTYFPTLELIAPDTHP
jgi:predicted nucleic acid-binding protein